MLSNLESVSSEIQPLHSLSRATPQGPQPVVHPGLDVIETMVTLGQNRAEPDHRDPAQAEALPVAVGGKGRVQQRWQAHALHLLQQQRNIVDSLRDDGVYVVHAQSLPQSGIPLQICANRERRVRLQGVKCSLYRRLIPKAAIFEESVVGRMPSSSAAPPGP